jgi:hypothetical protein
MRVVSCQGLLKICGSSRRDELVNRCLTSRTTSADASWLAQNQHGTGVLPGKIHAVLLLRLRNVWARPPWSRDSVRARVSAPVQRAGCDIRRMLTYVGAWTMRAACLPVRSKGCAL